MVILGMIIIGVSIMDVISAKTILQQLSAGITGIIGTILFCAGIVCDYLSDLKQTKVKELTE